LTEAPPNAETFETRGPCGTEALGRRLAKRFRAGDCVALIGPLGAGKTALVRGIAEGLGVADNRAVSSPTFVLVQEYAGRVPVYHVDLYRLGMQAGDGGAVSPSGNEANIAIVASELAGLGLGEMLAAGVVIIEWADRAADALPRPRWQIRIEHAGPRSRRFRVERVE
jgi:tRNA threonylcarbamoyladenosine biosynthesis protein TsaE